MPWTTDLPYTEAHGRRVGASLDHAVWFHRPFRADEWLLFTQESIVYVGARALTRGLFFSENGELVATATQETLLRRLRHDTDKPN
jgi:acyl-CoA thioesterase-2